MVTYFCRGCWNVIDDGGPICPNCGSEQKQFDAESFVAKLIRALRHREPSTPIRAAYILGQLKATEAVPALLSEISLNRDPFIVAAAVEALGEIGDRMVIPVIQDILRLRPPMPVRIAAKAALGKLQPAS